MIGFNPWSDLYTQGLKIIEEKELHLHSHSRISFRRYLGSPINWAIACWGIDEYNFRSCIMSF
jgi:hypothetical protein